MGIEDGLVIRAASLEWDYPPEFAGNRELANPCVAHLRQPTVAEYDASIEIGPGTVDIKRVPLVIAGIKSIDNLSYGGMPIRTGRELCSAGMGLTPLMQELYVEIKRHCDLEETDSKN